MESARDYWPRADKSKGGTIPVNEFMETKAKGVYAIGDVVAPAARPRRSAGALRRSKGSRKTGHL
jgi:thioredoxin reductase